MFSILQWIISQQLKLIGYPEYSNTDHSKYVAE